MSPRFFDSATVLHRRRPRVVQAVLRKIPGTGRRCDDFPARNARCVVIVAAVLYYGGLNSVQGASLIANGDFSASLNDWQKVGTVFDTGQSAILSDAGAPRSVVFQTAVVPDGVVLLRLSFDLLTALSPVAGLGQTPDSVFISAFRGAAPFGVNFDTAAFDTAIAILDADHRGLANLPFQLASGPSPKGQGWTHFTMPLPPVPFATVAFEFIDGNGVTGDSTAAVDNVFLEAEFIPEPQTSAVLTACGLLLMRRRRGLAELPSRV